MRLGKPAVIVKPGFILKRELDARGWDAEDFADIIGVSVATVYNLLSSRTALTVDNAILIGKALGQNPEIWIRLDAKYRMRIKSDDTTETAARSRMYSLAPIKEMVSRGWISKNNLSDGLNDFWGSAVDEKSLTTRAARMGLSLRKSDAYEQYKLYHLLIWHRKAELIASTYASSKFSRDKLTKLVYEIPKFTMQTDGIEAFLKGLRGCGVIFFVLKHLSKTYTDGALFWSNGVPVIVYTGRSDKTDAFWFTIAHEIGHILNDGGASTILEDREGAIDTNNEKEQRADAFARTILKFEEIKKNLSRYGRHISEKKVHLCAETVGVAEDIVVGCLQQAKMISYRSFNRFKTSALTAIPNEYKSVT